MTEEYFGLRCPRCAHQEGLRVATRCWVEILPEGTDTTGDHEWDDSSEAVCDCGWSGKAADLRR